MQPPLARPDCAPFALKDVHPGCQSPARANMLQSQGIATPAAHCLPARVFAFLFRRPLSNRLTGYTQEGVHPVPMPKPTPQPEPSVNLDSPRALTRESVRTLALEAGFSEAAPVALPHANEPRDAARLDHWIQAGRAGSMRYLTRRDESGQLIRSSAGIPFPWARSAIVCLASYNVSQPLSVNTSPPGAGWIARYAWSSRIDPSGQRRPSDYHKVLRKRLKALESGLRQQLGEFESRAYVDTGPIVERALATAAGLGWIAKNTCLINQRLGSFVFLGVLLTSLDLAQGERAQVAQDRCGSCARCIEACPTNALVPPYQMDATRCISYLTIEHRGPISDQLLEGMGRQVFGCDICQDVCPWNRKAPISIDPDLEPRPELVNPALDWLASLDEAAFERTFNSSPVRRAGFLGLRRNIAVAMGNSGAARFAGILERWANLADESPAAEGLRAAAQWARRKLAKESVLD
jgi:epoxyqueuosine reductase